MKGKGRGVIVADVMHNNSRAAYGRNRHKVARRSNVSARKCIRSLRSIESCVVLRDECSELLDVFSTGYGSRTMAW